MESQQLFGMNFAQDVITKSHNLYVLILNITVAHPAAIQYAVYRGVIVQWQSTVSFIHFSAFHFPTLHTVTILTTE